MTDSEELQPEQCIDGDDEPLGVHRCQHPEAPTSRTEGSVQLPGSHCNNSEFLPLLFAGPTGYAWVCSFPGDPGSADVGKWSGGPWVDNEHHRARVDAWADLNTYFCVAELKEVDGLGGRKKVNFLRLRALVVDDAVAGGILGTPSWTLRTSPGKEQTGVFIDPTDPDAADAALVDALMQELHRRKLLGDTSGNNLIRYVRLPVGTNGKPRESGPFRHELVTWNPKQVLSLVEACAVFGIDLDELRAKAKGAAATDMVLLGDGQYTLMAEAMQRIVIGAEYHDSLNRLAASMVASGTHPGAVTNLLRATMSAAQAPRDERWNARFGDIPRAVATASRKYQAEPSTVPGEPRDKEPLLVRAGDDLDVVDTIAWLIQNWLERDALAMLFGPPGIGKSFIAYDIACCVATGTPWRGFKVSQGVAIVVVGEGGAGIKRRLKAWSLENKVELKGAPLHRSTRAVPLLNAEAALELVAAIDNIVAEGGGMPPEVVVIDTLARNFGPGDENSTEDASKFIEIIDKHLRQRYRCNVILVHHTGHDGGRARGSSVFKAAMDQELSFTKGGYGDILKLTATKMKDAEAPRALEFRLKKVQIGTTSDDEPITSAVLETVGDVLGEVIYDHTTGKWTLGQVLELQEGGVAPSQRQMQERLGIPKHGATVVARRLIEKGLFEAGAQQKVRPRLTERAMKLLSNAGKLVGTGDQVATGGDD